MEEPLSLLVRSPAQRHRDLRLSARPAWTVRRLKTELRRLLPDAPVSAQSALAAAPTRVPARSPAGWVVRAGWLLPAGQRRQLPRGSRGAPGPIPAPARGVLVLVASAALGARLGYFGTGLWPVAVND